MTKQEGKESKLEIGAVVCVECEASYEWDGMKSLHVEKGEKKPYCQCGGELRNKESKQGATRRHKLNDLGDCINCRQIAVDQDDPCKGKAGR